MLAGSMPFIPHGLPNAPDQSTPSKEYLDAVDSMSGRFLATGQANPPEGVVEPEQVKSVWRDVWQKFVSRLKDSRK